MTTSAAFAIAEAVGVIEHWLDQDIGDIEDLVKRKAGSPQEILPLLKDLMDEHHGYLDDIRGDLDDLQKRADRLGEVASQKLWEEAPEGTQRWLASSRQCFALDKWSLCRLTL